MKLYYYILLITLIFFNCKEINKNIEQNETEYYYPSNESFNPQIQEKPINIDSIENFGKLLTVTEKISCEDQLPIIRINNKNTIFNFKIFKDCPDAMDVIDYKQRNIVLIQGDSIIVNVLISKPFDSLKKVLSNHLLNNGSSPNYSISLDKALFMYHQDSTYDSKKVKEHFIKLASVFNEVNSENGDSLELKIKLIEYPFTRIPIPQLPIE